MKSIFDEIDEIEKRSSPSIFDEIDAIEAEASIPLGQKALNVGGDLIAEAGGATAGQLIGTALAPFTFGASIPIGGAIGGGIGNTIAQFRQMARGDKEEFSFGELAGASGASAIPGGGLFKGIKNFRALGKSAAAGKIVQAGIEGAVVGAAQSGVKTAIDERGLPSFSDLTYGATGGLVFGTGLGALGQFGTRLATALTGKKPAEARTIIQTAMQGREGEELATLQNLAAKLDQDLGISAPKLTAAQVAPELTSIAPVKSAKESAEAMLRDEADSAQKSAEFLAAKTEESLQQAKGNQIAGPESVILGDDPLKNQLTAIETRPGASAKERSRVEAAIAARAPAVRNDSIRAKLSPQAQRMADEYGRVDPKALQTAGWATARAGAGFVVGAQYGDTPEERLGNGIAMAAGGAALSPAIAVKLGKSIADAQFTKQSIARVLPEAILGAAHEPLKKIPGLVASLSRDGFLANKALKEALDASPGEADAAFQFLTGNAPASALSPVVLKAAQSARDSVDELTDTLIRVGLAEGKLKDVLDANKGRYLRRGYRVFEEPNYKPAEKDVQDFVQKYVADEIAAGSQLPKDVLQQKGLNVATDLLSKGQGYAFNAAENFIKTGSVALGKSGELFKPRKSLDEATRRLLGEITDPVDALNQTIPRMAKIIAQEQAQKEMRDIGLKLGLFRQNAKPGDVATAPPSSGSYDNLAGLYVAPEVATALGKVTGPEDWGKGWRLLASATQLSKLSKTVLNPASYAPNLYSSLMAPLENGHLAAMFTGKNWDDAASVVMDEIGFASAPKQLEKHVKFLTEQRILGQSFNFRDLQRTMDQALIQIPGSAKTLFNGAAKVYGGSESLGRILSFAGELSRYRRAFPNMPQEQLMLRAAEMTRATVTNYSEVPDIVKKLSTAGVLETFVNFTYEQFRTKYNIARIGMRDMREGAETGNSALVAEGAKRLAAVSAFLVGGSAWGLSAYSRRKEGVSSEKEEALRRRLPDYDRNGILFFNEVTPENLAYSNQSYIFPSSIVGEALSAAARGDDPAKASLAFASVLASQLGGDGGVVIRPAIEALFTGQTAWGRDIATPEAPLTQQIGERAGYFLDRSLNPGIVKEIARMGQAFRGETGPNGEAYRVQDRIDRLWGMRINRVSIPVRFQREARNFSARLSKVAAHAGYLKQKDPAAHFEVVEAGRQKVFADMVQYLKDAEILEQPRETIIKNLRDAQVPTRLILGALEGRYPAGNMDGTPTPREIVQAMRLKPEDQQRAEFNRLALESPVMAKAVASAMRQELRNERRGLSEYDKLIGSLGATNGERARYIQERIDLMPSPEERRAYLLELRGKGLLPPEVYRQLTAQPK